MDVPKSLLEAVVLFSDNQKCEELLKTLRWKDGVKCPRCGSANVKYIESQKRWRCYHKRHKVPLFSVRTGTIFEHSQLPLSKWFVAVWLCVNAKNGFASWALHRALNCTQKTAWFVEMRIRDALKTRTRRLEGAVEVDEMFVGGRYRWMHGDRRREKPEKTIVLGLYERGGPVKTVVIPNRDRKTLHHEIKSTVAPGSKIFTDDLSSYQGLKPFYHHQSINHEAYAYVDGDAWTNSIEGFWSHSKRCIRGTHISVDKHYLPMYLDEETFRWNSRLLKDGERFIQAMRLAVSKKRIPYKKLTKRKTAKPRRGGAKRTPHRKAA